MTVIRPKPQLPHLPVTDRPAIKSKVQQGLAQVKDGFQPAAQRPPLDPAMIERRTHCFPDLGHVFEEGAGKIGEKLTDIIRPRPPLDSDVLYSLRLSTMTPKELFVEEAKQREILEDATTGPIQDPDAAAKAEKRLEAIEAERERRANADDVGPIFPPRLPRIEPLGVPLYDPEKKLV
ncbi:MAG TPA: hypothetical protein VK013_16675 [Myxococcaceae bacterium]|nr:hypothetical protein [Myxococcaceae bacterium]